MAYVIRNFRISGFSMARPQRSKDPFQPTPPRRQQARARAEAILDALDRLLAKPGAREIGLPMIAREVGIPLSSIYHLFPTLTAAFAGLVQRYNALMDADQLRVLAGPLPSNWQDLARTLMCASRGFYARYPVLARLVLNPAPMRAARAADDDHISELAKLFASELHRRFAMPEVPELEQRLAIGMAITDRIWSLGIRADGTIPDFIFEESVRALIGYLGHYLPPCLASRAGNVR